MVEYFGGKLDILPEPIHGKPANIVHTGGYTFSGITPTFVAARYHSLYARRETLPECFTVTAETEDSVIMAIEHKTLPWASVQFHPESILTAHGNGMRILTNCIRQFLKKAN